MMSVLVLKSGWITLLHAFSPSSCLTFSVLSANCTVVRMIARKFSNHRLTDMVTALVVLKPTTKHTRVQCSLPLDHSDPAVVRFFAA